MTDADGAAGAQLLQETQALQQSFLSEKDSLLQRGFIEEKAKLGRLCRAQLAKAQRLGEQQRQQQQMQQEAAAAGQHGGGGGGRLRGLREA